MKTTVDCCNLTSKGLLDSHWKKKKTECSYLILENNVKAQDTLTTDVSVIAVHYGMHMSQVATLVTYACFNVEECCKVDSKTLEHAISQTEKQQTVAVAHLLCSWLPVGGGLKEKPTLAKNWPGFYRVLPEDYINREWCELALVR